MVRGSKAGVSLRMTSHQDCGTAGLPQSAGSVSCRECVGMTSVPAGPTASSSAVTTACAPPATHPSCDSDAWTMTVAPAGRPSVASCATMPRTVPGTAALATASSSTTSHSIR